MKLIKSTCLVILSLSALIFSGCPLIESLMEEPEIINRNGKTYKSGFYGDLYFESERIAGGTPTFEYRNFTFYDLDIPGHDWIASRSINSKIYTVDSSFDRERNYYAADENFDFYCELSDRNGTTRRVKIQSPDIQKFTSLWTFAADHDYDPYNAGAQNGQEGHPMPEDSSIHLEARFYKLSKDGLFTSYKGNVFVMQDGKLQLLYYYDYANGNSSQSRMYTVELPEDLESYFRGLYNSAQMD